MDPVTHGITGALLGKAYFSERGGRVATFAAVLGAVFPDIDIVAELISRDPLAIVKYHRGITHSFVALPFFAMLLAGLIRWVARRRSIEAPSWGILTLVCGMGIASHIILDGMTSFGTRMWIPFSERRVAWDLLFIIDFVFSSIVLLPQVMAWVYRAPEGNGRSGSSSSSARAKKMWLLFSMAAIVVWGIALLAGYPFHLWVVALASGILMALFFLPGACGWGFRVKRSAWCQYGTYLMVAYLLGCGFAHHAAMQKVEAFAAANHIEAVRIGALPVPPSWLTWGDVIRTNDGIYQAKIDLRDARQISWASIPDSPRDQYVTQALQLPEVRLYWTFSRFPTIRSFIEKQDHIVDFGEHRYANGNRRSPQPFSYRVIFDDSGAVIAQGWLQNGMFMQLIKQTKPRHSDSSGGVEP